MLILILYNPVCFCGIIIFRFISPQNPNLKHKTVFGLFLSKWAVLGKNKMQSGHADSQKSEESKIKACRDNIHKHTQITQLIDTEIILYRI